MGFTIDNRPDEANAYAKPNSFLRFGYTVKNLNGTPYNEPYLTDVVVSVFDINSPIAKNTFNFTNGISHQYGTNVIAFALEIKDSELPKGKYRWEINHKRNINSVIENNVMFEGSFEVTSKHRSGCSITELIVTNTGIASITGLREELDARPKYETRFLNLTNPSGQGVSVSDGNFLINRPIIQLYNGDEAIINNALVYVTNNTTFEINYTGTISYVVIIYK